MNRDLTPTEQELKVKVWRDEIARENNLAKTLRIRAPLLPEVSSRPVWDGSELEDDSSHIYDDEGKRVEG